jgi:hypothetical protein
LLAAVFGVTALAFIGTSISSHTSVEENENLIKSDDDVDITDTDGKLFRTFSYHVCLDSNAWHLLQPPLIN